MSRLSDGRLCRSWQAGRGWCMSGSSAASGLNLALKQSLQDGRPPFTRFREDLRLICQRKPSSFSKELWLLCQQVPCGSFYVGVIANRQGQRAVDPQFLSCAPWLSLALDHLGNRGALHLQLGPCAAQLLLSCPVTWLSAVFPVGLLAHKSFLADRAVQLICSSLTLDLCLDCLDAYTCSSSWKWLLHIMSQT